MRGFRASRAVQNNKSARFGRHDENAHDQRFAREDEANSKHPQNAIRLRLPDWLRMPALRPTPMSIEQEPNVIPITRAKKRTKVAPKARARTATRKTRATTTTTRRRKAA